MKNRLGKKEDRAGLSLLELVLAMTMIGIVILAGTHLDLAAARMSGSLYGDIAVQNDLLYLVRTVEHDLLDADAVVIQTAPSPADPTYTLKLTIGGQDVFYTISANAVAPFPVTIKKKTTVAPAAGDPAITANTPGTALLARLDSQEPPQPLQPIEISQGSPIVKLNLAAQKTLENGKVLANSGLSKSIFLRTAKVT